eukprot:179328_1
MLKKLKFSEIMSIFRNGFRRSIIQTIITVLNTIWVFSLAESTYTKYLTPEAYGKTLAINCDPLCIDIISASYGSNCDYGLKDNELTNLKNACNNKTMCHYMIDENNEIVADFSRCNKDFFCEYKCVANCRKYLYYDGLNSISDWKFSGKVSIVSSPKCPSITNYTATFEGTKICISNSYNFYWDGQYEWQYHDHQINGSIYYNSKSNKYIYEYANGKTREYYMNDYKQDTISMTRCTSGNVTKITDCMGKWKREYNGTWHIDHTMISTFCNDICMNAMVEQPANARFVWLYHNITSDSDIYHCVECEDDIYLYISYQSAGGSYQCQLQLNDLILDTFISEDNEDCMNAFLWSNNPDLLLSECVESNSNHALDTLSSLPIFQESEICVEKSYNSSLDGKYKWLYYDFAIAGSIYYNPHKKMYIQPQYINTTHYEYHIYGTMLEYETIHAKCSLVLSEVTNIPKSVPGCVEDTRFYGKEIYVQQEAVYDLRNQGMITAITWGKWDQMLSGRICSFAYEFIGFGNISVYDTSTVGTCSAGHIKNYPRELCAPLNLDDDDYIHGYRVLYNEWFVVGLYFYTFKNNTYHCVGNIDLIEYMDSGIIMKPGYYLSGFRVEDGQYKLLWISFQFTSINRNKCIWSPTDYFLDCIGRWQMYINNTWNIDTNMISSPCQDVCGYGNDLQSVTGNTDISMVVTYSHFDTLRGSNVYEHTIDEDQQIYLFGWVDTPSLITSDSDTGYFWVISREYNAMEVCTHYPCNLNIGSFCAVGPNKGEQYIFNINDCLDAGSWYTLSNHDQDMSISKCYPQATEMCYEVQSNSEIHRTYSIHGNYKDLAVGFDASLFISSILMVQYSCTPTVHSYHVLTKFESNLMVSSIINFAYNLPSELCDNSSSVSIKFVSNGTNA